MANRAKPIRRIKQPLAPANSVVFVSGVDVSILPPEELTANLVGLKAYGLASIPAVWTKPYFVVSGGSSTFDQGAIDRAFELARLPQYGRVLVRSSGVNESIESRGTLVSSLCGPREVADEINRLIASTVVLSAHSGEIHWLIQEFAPTVAKGHLSNERRLNKDLRDWMAEVEPSPNNPTEAHRIAIRTWRDAALRESHPLTCPYRANYIDRLEDVARWAYQRKIRVHFEWVWDGATIHIVQADACDLVSHGVAPESLIALTTGKVADSSLKAFRIARPNDFSKYRKLANAGIYNDLGYQMPNFYVLDDPCEIQHIVEFGRCSANLIHDLLQLTIRPLVIRTDGVSIPSQNRQMLPRSDELRSTEAAQQWLIEKFRNVISNGPLSNCQLCLMAHHFIPSVASAWCQAYPSRRRVRIESLWGIPEGLYWYAHDVFDVDTCVSNILVNSEQPKSFRVRERTRFKERFIAPDNTGAWIVHQTSAGADWKRSIRQKEWIDEIAWTTRKIAQAVGHPVVVMWFVDIPREVSHHRVLPWYHEKWTQKGALLRAVPRGKFSSSVEFPLRTRLDWELLQARLDDGDVSRVIVDPSESDMVRDQQFATSLAALAKRYGFIVELAGGILSHAYYMLSNSGCTVECVDLDEYALEDDEVEFNKLVRDKIPGSISARGEDVDVFRLKGEALILALRRKLVEEAFEVVDAPTTMQIAEELADLREVMIALASRLSISEEEIESARLKKAKNRGAFADGLMLSKTSLASSFSSVEYDRLKIEFSKHERTLSLPSDLPSTASEIHSDKRFYQSGVMERQFTVVLPAHADGIAPPRTIFSLNTHDGSAHEMLLEVQLERVNAELRCRLRLINTPKQLELPLIQTE